MSAEFSWQVDGLKELEDMLVDMGNEFGGVEKATKKVLIPAVRESMRVAADKVRQTAPYDEQNTSDHHMRDTVKIFARVRNKRDERSSFVDEDTVVTGIVSVTTDKRRLAMEFGTAKVAARPFLQPALVSTAQTMVKIFGSYLAYKIPQVFKSKKR